MLSMEELENAAERLEFTADVKEMLKECDTDKSGFIDYTEFLTATVNKAQAYSKERLKEVFNIFDKNGDGKISLDELKTVLGGNGKSDEMFRRMIKEADTNGDGEIDLEEFIAHISGYSSS